MTETANQEKLSDGVRAVDRALDILMAFTTQDYELSASELLSRVSLSRPTMYRLLYTLEQKGFVTSSGDPQKFRLGPSVAYLSHVWSSSLDISSVAQPIMRRIWETTGETVALFVPQGNFRSCIAEIPSNQPLSFKRGIGYREHIVRGASGRAILAFSKTTHEQLQEYLSPLNLELNTYLEELELTRKRGYAMSQDELIKGAVAVAVPFFSNKDIVSGSIGVFGPTVRMDKQRIEKIADLLRTEAGNLSKSLGYL